ncbi:MAG: enoyl-CoA hydratase/isomerase family protein [Thermodesulfobacteriota bacterium]|nr:enoyl-CoA hydratase/isomerase family protein [Thermodesulfobacteriota bacterium]
MEFIYEVKENIAFMTINRPEVRNALNNEITKQLLDSVVRAKEDDDVRVIVIRSTGDNSFSAGADLSMLKENRDDMVGFRSGFKIFAELLYSLTEVGKPTIAAVQGYALAGGCGIAAACDLTIAAEKAKFGLTEINVGFWAMVITAPIFRAVGMKNGLELCYTGKIIDAEEAKRIGMVNRVVPNESLEQEVMRLAKDLASKNPVAMRLGREAYYTTRDMEYGKALKYLSELVIILASTEGCKEGIAAFLEKREPEWEGK